MNEEMTDGITNDRERGRGEGGREKEKSGAKLHIL